MNSTKEYEARWKELKNHIFKMLGECSKEVENMKNVPFDPQSLTKSIESICDINRHEGHYEALKYIFFKMLEME